MGRAIRAGSGRLRGLGAWELRAGGGGRHPWPWRLPVAAVQRERETRERDKSGDREEKRGTGMRSSPWFLPCTRGMTDGATPAALERGGRSGAVLQWLRDRSSGGIRMGSAAGRGEEAMERTGRRWIERGGGRGDLVAVGGERWLGRDGSRWGFGGVVARLGGWDRSLDFRVLSRLG